MCFHFSWNNYDWKAGMIGICLIFWDTARQFSKVYESPVVVHPYLPTYDMVSLLNFIYSNICVVMCCSGFNLQFSNDWCSWASFHALICHLYTFGKVSSNILLNFFLLIFFVSLLISLSSLYILDVSLTCVWICKYFLRVCGFSFCFLMHFEDQQFLISIKYNLLIFSFIDYPFGDISKKASCNLMSQKFSKSFVVLGFTYRSTS